MFVGLHQYNCRLLVNKKKCNKFSVTKLTPYLFFNNFTTVVVSKELLHCWMFYSTAIQLLRSTWYHIFCFKATSLDVFCISSESLQRNFLDFVRKNSECRLPFWSSFSRGLDPRDDESPDTDAWFHDGDSLRGVGSHGTVEWPWETQWHAKRVCPDVTAHSIPRHLRRPAPSIPLAIPDKLGKTHLSRYLSAFW